ncbi:uncharacterized protein LOC123563254 isoform X1 [Mercenaria mercenaria]|uniref:uncharacterized protein LOC123563254 isoform X1 n=1 Tax=Mercenaria mercenaria TaxID=6596 RepID=UPI00234F9938|nr:uncharacterized protein LOC123563254 isoform X1 [Mercenaria mercenaria]
MSNSVKLVRIRKSHSFSVKPSRSWTGSVSSIQSDPGNWSLRSQSLKMRPVLDFRMPTLANKGPFLLPIEDIAAKTKSRLQHLESHPPSSLRDVRQALAGEIKAIQKKLTRLERSYYGVGKSLNHEVKKYATPIKILVRMLGYFELPSVKAVEAALKYGSDPKRYKGDPENVQLLKEAYTKVQSFVPAKFTDVTELCEKMLELLEKYCISFYEPDGEIEVETALHYETQIRTWKRVIRETLGKINELMVHFKNRGIHYTMFTSTVATFCQRNECEIVPFLMLFAEACTNIRTVLSIMTQWLKSDENYSVFLQNDVTDLERQKEEQTKVMREAREHYHSAMYKVNQAETEYTKLMHELENLQEKEEANEIEETFLINKCNELEMDMEFKESRRDDLKNKPLDADIESLAITWDNLNEEIRFLKDNLPGVKRQLATVQHRREWMTERRHQLEKMEKEIAQLTKEAKVAEKDKTKREAEYETIEKTLEVSRRLLLHKTSNDSVSKIFYDLPITARNNKAKLPSISNGTDGTLDKACSIVVKHIDQDWIQLYRNLPFFPSRGSETIEKDIASIAVEGARGPKEDISAVALARWRRHHTRARAEDLKQGLRAIKRFEIMKAVDLIIHPPPVIEEPPEYIPPELDPSLIPHYRDIVKLDKLIAAKRIQVHQLSEED